MACLPNASIGALALPLVRITLFSRAIVHLIHPQDQREAESTSARLGDRVHAVLATQCIIKYLTYVAWPIASAQANHPELMAQTKTMWLNVAQMFAAAAKYSCKKLEDSSGKVC